MIVRSGGKLHDATRHPTFIDTLIFYCVLVDCTVESVAYPEGSLYTALHGPHTYLESIIFI